MRPLELFGPDFMIDQINIIENNPTASLDILNTVVQIAKGVGSFETANEIKSIIQQRQERIEASEKAKVYGDILTKAFETVGLNPDISLSNINKENTINELTKRLEISKIYEELATKYLQLETEHTMLQQNYASLETTLADKQKEFDKQILDNENCENNLVECQEKLQET